MEMNVTLGSICIPSEEVVVREIEGDTLIVPLAAGIVDADDELYTVNETGQAILKHLDGINTLALVAELLAENFTTSTSEIESDVLGFSAEMVKRGILTVKA